MHSALVEKNPNFNFLQNHVANCGPLPKAILIRIKSFLIYLCSEIIPLLLQSVRPLQGGSQHIKSIKYQDSKP